MPLTVCLHPVGLRFEQALAQMLRREFPSQLRVIRIGMKVVMNAKEHLFMPIGPHLDRLRKEWGVKPDRTHDKDRARRELLHQNAPVPYLMDLVSQREPATVYAPANSRTMIVSQASCAPAGILSVTPYSFSENSTLWPPLSV